MSVEAIKIKEEKVAAIEEKIVKAKGIVLLDYRGINVEEDTRMRAALREANVEYKVIKNRLMVRAFKKAGYEGFDTVLEGPTAVAFSYEDAVVPAKIIVENIKKINKMTIKAGVVEGKMLDGNAITAVAKIPSKEILLAQLLGLLTSPMRSLAIAVSEVAKQKS